MTVKTDEFKKEVLSEAIPKGLRPEQANLLNAARIKRVEKRIEEEKAWLSRKPILEIRVHEEELAELQRQLASLL
jgi:hypothetical protein